MVFPLTEKKQIKGSLEGDQIAHQLTSYANIKRVKKLFLIVKLTSFVFLHSKYGLKHS